MDFAFLADGKTCHLAWGSVEQSAEPSENAFYINNFQLSRTPWLKFEHTRKLEGDFSTLREFLSYLPATDTWNFESFESFQDQYKYFQQQKLQKFLLTVCDEGVATTHLKSIPQTLFYFYGFSLRGKGAWGMSPELLFQLDCKANEIKTMALAGTFAGQAEARHTPEHSLVVQFFQQLAKSNHLQISQREQEVSNYGKIKHLKTEITFKGLQTSDPNYWVKQFHPTPALGVAPRTQENLAILQDFRNSLPEYFGAPMGFRDQEEVKVIVMIRGQFFDGNKIYRPIGVGVTPASNVEAEWSEIYLKRLAMEELWRPLI